MVINSNLPSKQQTQWHSKALQEAYNKVLVFPTHVRSSKIEIHGEVTPCHIKNNVQRKFATPILYAIDISKNYDFFSIYT